MNELQRFDMIESGWLDMDGGRVLYLYLHPHTQRTKGIWGKLFLVDLWLYSENSQQYRDRQVKSKKVSRKNLFCTSILLSNLKMLPENIITNNNYSDRVDASSNRKWIRIRWKSFSLFIGHLTSQSSNFGVTRLEV
jgi:hypothetical protein